MSFSWPFSGKCPSHLVMNALLVYAGMLGHQLVIKPYVSVNYPPFDITSKVLRHLTFINIFPSSLMYTNRCICDIPSENKRYVVCNICLDGVECYNAMISRIYNCIKETADRNCWLDRASTFEYCLCLSKLCCTRKNTFRKYNAQAWFILLTPNVK